MGLDCNYQGVPSGLSIIEKAKVDLEFAENVFYPFIAYTKKVEDLYYFKESEFEEIRHLIQQFPNLKNWNFNPVSRMQWALIYVLSPKSYEESEGSEDLKKSFYYQFVMGETSFSENLKTTQGIPVRVSSPGFVKKCVDFSKNVNLPDLSRNFNASKMESLGIYKVFQDSSPQPVLDYFSELSNFYENIASKQDMQVFVTVD